jgi:hypothetical protein
LGRPLTAICALRPELRADALRMIIVPTKHNVTSPSDFLFHQCPFD